MLLVYENKDKGISAEWKKTVHMSPHLHEAIEVVYVTNGNIALGVGMKLSTEIPILENVEDREYYGRSVTEIQNVVDIRYNKQPLIAFLYDDDTMSVPALDDLINSQTEFSKSYGFVRICNNT